MFSRFIASLKAVGEGFSQHAEIKAIVKLITEIDFLMGELSQLVKVLDILEKYNWDEFIESVRARDPVFAEQLSTYLKDSIQDCYDEHVVNRELTPDLEACHKLYQDQERYVDILAALKNMLARIDKATPYKVVRGNPRKELYHPCLYSKFELLGLINRGGAGNTGPISRGFESDITRQGFKCIVLDPDGNVLASRKKEQHEMMRIIDLFKSLGVTINQELNTVLEKFLSQPDAGTTFHFMDPFRGIAHTLLDKFSVPGQNREIYFAIISPPESSDKVSKILVTEVFKINKTMPRGQELGVMSDARDLPLFEFEFQIEIDVTEGVRNTIQCFFTDNTEENIFSSYVNRYIKPVGLLQRIDAIKSQAGDNTALRESLWRDLQAPDNEDLRREMKLLAYRAALLGDATFIGLYRILSETEVEIPYPPAEKNPAMHLLHYICANGHLEALKVFISSYSPHENLIAQDSIGNTPWHYAALRGHYKVIEFACHQCGFIKFNQENHAGNTPLHLAAKNGHEDIVRLFLANNQEFRFDLNQPNKEGLIPSHLAIDNGHISMLSVFNEFCDDIMLLIDQRGHNILHQAILNKQKKLVKRLLKKFPQAVTNEKNPGRSACHLAAEVGDEEILEMVLNAMQSNVDHASEHDLVMMGLRHGYYHDKASQGEGFIEVMGQALDTLSGTKKYSKADLERLCQSQYSDHASNQQGYRINKVSRDGECGYTAFGITRNDATRILIERLLDIREMIKPAVREALLSEEFYQYLIDTESIDDSISHQHITDHLDQFVVDLAIQKSYLVYDVQQKKIGAGYAHPSVLRALAEVQKVELRIWRLGENQVLIPHRVFDEDYARYIPATVERRIDLLFVDGNHFELLEFDGYQNQNGFPDDDERILPYGSPSHDVAVAELPVSASIYEEGRTLCTQLGLEAFFVIELSNSSREIIYYKVTPQEVAVASEQEVEADLFKVPCLVTLEGKKRFAAIQYSDLDELRNIYQSDSSEVKLNKRDRTILHEAAKNGHDQVVDWVLSRGLVDVDAVDDDGNTALMVATKENKEDVSTLLLQRYSANKDICNSDGQNFFALALEFFSDTYLRWLIAESMVDVDDTFHDGTRPIHRAAISGKMAVINLLIELDGDLSVQDGAGNTALHHAVLSGKSYIIRRLLDAAPADFDVFAKNNAAKTALDLALELERTDCVRVLYGDHVNTRTSTHDSLHSLLGEPAELELTGSRLASLDVKTVQHSSRYFRDRDYKKSIQQIPIELPGEQRYWVAFRFYGFTILHNNESGFKRAPLKSEVEAEVTALFSGRPDETGFDRETIQKCISQWFSEEMELCDADWNESIQYHDRSHCSVASEFIIPKIRAKKDFIGLVSGREYEAEPESALFKIIFTNDITYREGESRAERLNVNTTIKVVDYTGKHYFVSHLQNLIDGSELPQHQLSLEAMAPPCFEQANIQRLRLLLEHTHSTPDALLKYIDIAAAEHAVKLARRHYDQEAYTFFASVVKGHVLKNKIIGLLQSAQGRYAPQLNDCSSADMFNVLLGTPSDMDTKLNTYFCFIVNYLEISLGEQESISELVAEFYQIMQPRRKLDFLTDPESLITKCGDETAVLVDALFEQKIFFRLAADDQGLLLLGSLMKKSPSFRKCVRRNIKPQSKEKELRNKERNEWCHYFQCDAEKLYPMSALHIAAKYGNRPVLQQLVAVGMDVNAVDQYGMTALHHAVLAGHADTVALLVEMGANVNALVYHVFSPMLIALMQDDVAMMQCLVERCDADINIQTQKIDNSEEGEFLDNEDLFGQFDYNEYLSETLNQGLAHAAVLVNKFEAFRYLVDHDVNLLLENSDEETCLDLVVKLGRVEFVEYLVSNTTQDVMILTQMAFLAIEHGHLDIVQCLERHGADLGRPIENSQGGYPDGVTCLQVAADHCSPAMVQYLLQRYPELRGVKDESGWLPIHCAAYFNDLQVVQYFLASDPECYCEKTDDHFNLLHLAVWNTKHPEVLRYLLRTHPDLVESSFFIEDAVKNNLTAMFRIVLEQYPDFVNHRIKNKKFTLLQVAADHCSQGIFGVLLTANNIDIEASNDAGFSALHFLAQGRRIGEVMYGYWPTHPIPVSFKGIYQRMLLRLKTRAGSRFHRMLKVQEFENGRTPLQIAVSRGNNLLVKTLLENGADHKDVINLTDKEGNTALHLAVMGGNLEAVEMLSKCSAQKVGIKNKHGKTPLDLPMSLDTPNRKEIIQIVVNLDHKPFMQAAQQGDAEIIKKQLDAGFDVNQMDESGLSSLHYAVLHKRYDVVRMLIKAGANVNEQPFGLYTPLLIALLQDDVKMMRILVKEGKADIHKQSSIATQTDLVNFKKCKPLQKLMVGPCRSAVGIAHTAVYFNKLKGLQYLISLGIDISSVDSRGNNLLHRAAMRNHLGMFHLLCRYGLYAENTAKKRPAQYLMSPSKYMQKRGIYPLLCPLPRPQGQGYSRRQYTIEDSITDNVNSVLDAFWRGIDAQDLSQVETALNQGAVVNQFDKHDMRPLHYAVLAGNYELVRLLLSYGADVDALALGQFPSVLIALMQDDHEMLRVLIEEGCASTVINAEKMSYGQEGKYSHKHPLFALFGDRRIYKSKTLDQLSVRWNKPSWLKQLVALKIDSFSRDTTLAGDLMAWSARFGYVDCLQFIVATYENRLQELVDCLDRVFIYAAIGGHLDVVLYLEGLVQNNARTTCPRLSGNALFYAVKYQHESVVEYLVERHSYLNKTPNKEGQLPIHYAAKNKLLASLKLLLSDRNNKNLYKEKDANGYSVMHLAVCYWDDNDEMVLYLLHHYPDLMYERNNKGHTLWEIIVRRAEPMGLVSLLLEAGAVVTDDAIDEARKMLMWYQSFHDARPMNQAQRFFNLVGWKAKNTGLTESIEEQKKVVALLEVTMQTQKEGRVVESAEEAVQVEASSISVNRFSFAAQSSCSSEERASHDDHDPVGVMQGAIPLKAM
ncbi:MAG: ankyrin repeat domain-containing protein [Gammaproteobacteria bacterium]|nr:ankyrin repeat domain-containing protein [Gammaproteobacteria bacterium]MCH9744324.1 ankyrin repeat domain-containing protein [Gammaproteobacteria bacterium]